MPAGTLPLEADVRLNLPVLLVTIAVAARWRARLRLRARLAGDERRPRHGPARGGPRHRRRPQRLRRTLVAAEFALALTLLSGAGIAAGSLMRRARRTWVSARIAC